MVGSLAQVQQRMGTVETASKITTAMKLVSLSKLQKYKRLSQQVIPFRDAYETIPSQAASQDDRPRVTVCIVPDLGLATAYTQGIIKFLRANDCQKIFWIGGQRFEKIQANPDFEVLNSYQSSENIDLNWLYTQVAKYIDDYHVQMAMPVMNNESVEFQLRDLNQELAQSEFTLYEPSYELAAAQYQTSHLLIHLYDLFYQSKVAEYTTRRIAMEKATDNAKEMKQALQNQYNRIRQEKITQEIAELTSGVL